MRLAVLLAASLACVGIGFAKSAALSAHVKDLETLQNTNASLISTLDEVMQIQADGRMKRQAAEVELRKMEDELKNKLLEIR